MASKKRRTREKLAKADLYPSIVAFGSARSNYSNQGLTVDGFRDELIPQTIIFNGIEQVIGFQQQFPNYVKKPYVDQVTDNLSYGFGLSASIPIYNNNLTSAAVQKSKLNAARANLNYIQSKETLKITIGQALSDARAAKSRYQASTKTLNAQTNLYNNALKRFDIGNLNAFELTRLKSQMETTSVNLLIAKYDYFFRTKVLDFYLGKPIRF
ncbi:MAG: TolC family protein [Saprospiraceae bacterium]|nr:TolC family protein [Saprospiraceae bacterium]